MNRLEAKGEQRMYWKKTFFFLRITFEVFPRILFCVILNEPLAYNFRSDFPGERFFKLTRLWQQNTMINFSGFIHHVFKMYTCISGRDSWTYLLYLFFFEGGVVTPTKILTIIFTAYKKSKYMLSIIKKKIIITNPYSLP